MLKQLDIKNFQSHRKTSITLHPGVNVFVGASDCGKSAILRALDWVLTNTPSGEEFRSWWGGETSVSLIFAELDDDETHVSRVRDGKTNIYVLHGDRLAAIGQSVPEQVQKAINFSQLNRQRQFDAPFLLSSSAGEVGRMLNAICHLDIIDTSMMNINRDVTSLKQAVVMQEEAIQTEEQKLLTFQNVEEMETLGAVMAQRDDWLADANERRERLVGLVRQARSSAATLETIGDVRGADETLREIEEQNRKVTVLYNDITRFRLLTNQVVAGKKRLESCPDVTGAEAALRKMEGRVVDGARISRLRDLLRMVLENQWTADNARDIISRLEASMPKTCPTCGAEVKI